MYIHTNYPTEGFFLVKELETGGTNLVCNTQGCVMAIWNYPQATALPNWLCNILDAQHKEEIEPEQPQDGMLKINEDLLLKIMAVSRGQKMTGL